jgi:photosystem II stability/assembly factor-like uncharacterized protein
MSWNSTLGCRGRALTIASAFAAVSLGLAACHQVVPEPPPRKGFAITDKFFDVESIGKNSFLLLGYRSHISRSDDGGKTWKNLKPPTDRSFTRLAFLNDKVGWGVGHEGIIYKTEDAAETWTKEDSSTKNPLFDLSITSPNTVWAVGDVSTIVHTTDGGKTWTPPECCTKDGKLPISMIGVREDQTLAISDPIFYGIACVDENTCFVTGEFGQIRMTTDGGKTWGAGHKNLLGSKYRDVMSMPSLLAVAAHDAKHAVAVGTYGMIASTEDGENWHWNDSPVDTPFYDIRPLPGGDYLAVGASGTVVLGNPETGWKLAKMPPGVYTWLSAAGFDEAGNGVAGGGHGVYLTTQDFGKTWEWKANG